jgi:hypothetical protein
MPITKLAIVRNTDVPDMANPSDNPIRDYILRVMTEQNWRPVDVLENAKKLKIKLRQATFAEVYAGQTKNPGIFTLMKISKALGRPFEEMVAEIQGRIVAKAAPFRPGDPLSEMYEQMGTKERKIADRLLEMLKREFTELLSGNVR